MSYVESNVDVWRKLYSEGKNDLMYPNDLLVRISYNLFPKNKSLKIFDFGFGTGANTLHFSRMGHDVYGAEISNDAIRLAKAKFDLVGLKPKLELYSPGTKLNYEDNFFDVTISWQVLYYNDWDSLSFIVKELMRVTKPGGLVVVSIAAPGDVSHRNAVSMGDSLYRSSVPGQEGCILLIPEEYEIQRMFPAQNLEIGFFEFKYSNSYAKHWIITFQKG